MEINHKSHKRKVVEDGYPCGFPFSAPISQSAMVILNKRKFDCCRISTIYEVHMAVNLGLKTTSVMTVSSGSMSIRIHEYVDGEEHDANTLGSGDLLKQYDDGVAVGVYSRENGKDFAVISGGKRREVTLP